MSVKPANASAQVYVNACNRTKAEPSRELLEALERGDRECTVGGRTRLITDVDLFCISDVLRGPHSLRCLVIEDGSFSENAITGVLEALAENPGHLRELRLGKNKLKDSHAVAIATVMQTARVGLKVLDFSENGLTRVGASAICDAICSPHYSDVIEVSFHNNALEADAGVTLANAIRNSPKLKHLHLGYNQLKDAGATQLARCIPIAPLLSTLDLTANRIGPQGGQELARALMTSTCKLQRLNLRSNNLDDETLLMFSEVLLRNTSLTQLYLGYMTPTPQTAATILSALRHNKTLLMLDIYGWKLDHGVCGQIIEDIMTQNTNVRAITSDACQPIFHAIDKHNWERQEKALHDIYIGPDDRHSAIAASVKAQQQIQQRSAAASEARSRSANQPQQQSGSSTTPTMTPRRIPSPRRALEGAAPVVPTSRPTSRPSSATHSRAPSPSNNLPPPPQQLNGVQQRGTPSSPAYLASTTSNGGPTTATGAAAVKPNQSPQRFGNTNEINTNNRINVTSPGNNGSGSARGGVNTTTMNGAGTFGFGQSPQPSNPNPRHANQQQQQQQSYVATTTMLTTQSSVFSTANTNKNSIQQSIATNNSNNNSNNQRFLSPAKTSANASATPTVGVASPPTNTTTVNASHVAQQQEITRLRSRVSELEAQVRTLQSQLTRCTCQKAGGGGGAFGSSGTTTQSTATANTNQRSTSATRTSGTNNNMNRGVTNAAGAPRTVSPSRGVQFANSQQGGAQQNANSNNNNNNSSNAMQQHEFVETSQNAFNQQRQTSAMATASLFSSNQVAQQQGRGGSLTRNNNNSNNDTKSNTAYTSPRSNTAATYGTRDVNNANSNANNARASHFGAVSNTNHVMAGASDSNLNSFQANANNNANAQQRRGGGAQNSNQNVASSAATNNNATSNALLSFQRLNSMNNNGSSAANNANTHQSKMAAGSGSASQSNINSRAGSALRGSAGSTQLASGSNSNAATSGPFNNNNNQSVGINNNNRMTSTNKNSAYGQRAQSMINTSHANTGRFSASNVRNGNFNTSTNNNYNNNMSNVSTQQRDRAQSINSSYAGGQRYDAHEDETCYSYPDEEYGPSSHRPATDFRDPYQDADEFYGNPTGRASSQSPPRVTEQSELVVPLPGIRDEKVDRCWQPNIPQDIRDDQPRRVGISLGYQPEPVTPMDRNCSQPNPRPNDLPGRKMPSHGTLR